MNSRLERARRFLLGGSRSTALRVAPLALLALGALQAATVTVEGPDYRSGGGSINSSVINTPNGAGVKFFGSASSDFDFLTSTNLLEFDFVVNNDGGPTTQLDFIFGVSFLNDISLKVTDGAATTYFQQGIFVIVLPPDFESFNSGGEFSSNSQLLDVVELPSFSGNALLVNNGTVRFSLSSSSPFSIDIPGDSIDFTPTASAVPEPGTMALALAGAAALAIARRRRE